MTEADVSTQGGCVQPAARPRHTDARGDQYPSQVRSRSRHVCDLRVDQNHSTRVSSEGRNSLPNPTYAGEADVPRVVTLRLSSSSPRSTSASLRGGVVGS